VRQAAARVLTRLQVRVRLVAADEGTALSEPVRMGRAEIEAVICQRWGEFQERLRELLAEEEPRRVPFAPQLQTDPDGVTRLQLGPDFEAWMADWNGTVGELAILALLDLVYGPDMGPPH
jgi:hypothetical protein